MTDRLEAKKGNIICPGYENHKPRVLDEREAFDLTDSGDVVCRQCKEAWVRRFYPQEDTP